MLLWGAICNRTKPYSSLGWQSHLGSREGRSQLLTLVSCAVVVVFTGDEGESLWGGVVWGGVVWGGVVWGGVVRGSALSATASPAQPTWFSQLRSLLGDPSQWHCTVSSRALWCSYCRTRSYLKGKENKAGGVGKGGCLILTLQRVHLRSLTFDRWNIPINWVFGEKKSVKVKQQNSHQL